jgi:hypothetical protein
MNLFFFLWEKKGFYQFSKELDPGILEWVFRAADALLMAKGENLVGIYILLILMQKKFLRAMSLVCF